MKQLSSYLSSFWSSPTSTGYEMLTNSHVSSALGSRPQPVAITARSSALVKRCPRERKIFPSVPTFLIEVTSSNDGYVYHMWGESESGKMTASRIALHQVKGLRGSVLRLYGNGVIINGGRFSVEVRIRDNTYTGEESMPFLVEVEVFSPGFFDSIETAYMGIGAPPSTSPSTIHSRD